jgi:Xaa-Pro aminopeptidase
MTFARYERRVDTLISLLRSRNLDAFACFCFEGSNWESLYYLSGFRGSAGALLVGFDEVRLIVDGRYTAQARSQSPFPVIPQEGRLSDQVEECLRSWRVRRIGLEDEKLSHARWRHLTDRIPDVEDASDLLPLLRRRKDEEERRLLREAVQYAESALWRTLAKTGAGMSEREFAALLEYEIRIGGAEGGWGGEFVIASGPRSALPHGRPTDRRFAPGEWFVVDFGARYGGYVSDITRTVSLGKPDPFVRELHDLLVRAQREAESVLRVGASGIEADAATRAVLHLAGRAGAFPHGTGHGIGLELHEVPRLSPRSEDRLREGDVVTLEPGLYYEGRGGARIEDDYLVEEEGAFRLTSLPREILVV